MRYFIIGGAIFVAAGSLFAWALCRAAALGDRQMELQYEHQQAGEDAIVLPFPSEVNPN